MLALWRWGRGGGALTDRSIYPTTGTKVQQMSMVHLTSGEEPPSPPHTHPPTSHEWGQREKEYVYVCECV